MTTSKSTSTSNIALYRKYRPQTFADVVEQDAVVNTLKSSIEQGRIAHAYIFAGSRGTGKTSIARIYARALKVSDNDVYEIDAASNRGIDDIREIREGVNVSPFESPYKVYIIDEVHMLTKEAWNALLKTLEEPPAHALFILATTELEKIPDTIISRCQVFSFKKPSRDTLKAVVTKVAKKESVVLEAGVAELIALLGDGSFRDTLGTLDKIISSSDGKKVSMTEAEAITGAPQGTLVNEFIRGILVADATASLDALHKAVESGASVKSFASLTLEKFRILLMMKTAPKFADKLRDLISEDDWKVLGEFVTAHPERIVSATLVELLKSYDLIGHSYIPALPLELAVIKLGVLTPTA